jgi:hypothetical protein
VADESQAMPSRAVAGISTIMEVIESPLQLSFALKEVHIKSQFTDTACCHFGLAKLILKSEETFRHQIASFGQMFSRAETGSEIRKIISKMQLAMVERIYNKLLRQRPV